MNTAKHELAPGANMQDLLAWANGFLVWTKNKNKTNGKLSLGKLPTQQNTK